MYVVGPRPDFATTVALVATDAIFILL